MLTFYDFNGISASKMENILRFEGFEQGKDYDIIDGTLVISAQGRRNIFSSVMTDPSSSRLLSKMTVDFRMTGPLYFFDILKDYLNTFGSNAVFDEASVIDRILNNRLIMLDFSTEALTNSKSVVFKVNFNTLIDTLNIARQQYIDIWNGANSSTFRYSELTNMTTVIMQLLPSSYNNECHFIVDYTTLHKLGKAFDNSTACLEIQAFSAWLKTLPMSELLVPNPEDSLCSWDEAIIWRD